jgi:drug/metabolite transporter (DMT)-like permease
LKLVSFAPILFVILWSTGFVGAKYGLPYADPFIFLAVRVLIAALLLFAIAALLKSPIAIGKSAISRSALIGFFLHACYLGGVFFAISKGLPAGVAAVVTSVQPVLVSLLAVKLLGEALNRKQILGLILGLVGVITVLAPSFQADLPRCFKRRLAQIFHSSLAPPISTLQVVRYSVSQPLQQVKLALNGAMNSFLPLFGLLQSYLLEQFCFCYGC